MALRKEAERRLAELDIDALRALCQGPDLRLARAYCWFTCTLAGALALVIAAYLIGPAISIPDIVRWLLASAFAVAGARAFIGALNASRPGREPRWLLELFGRRELAAYRARIDELRRRIRLMEGAGGFIWRLTPMVDRRGGSSGNERLLHVLQVSRDQPGKILEWVQPVEYVELLDALRDELGSRAATPAWPERVLPD